MSEHVNAPSPLTPAGRPVAVVTGASRGLGFLLARQLARRGHDVVICARSEAGLAVAAADLAQTGARVHAVVCDVSVKADVERLIAEATAAFGRIDVLVNNAGLIQVGPMATMTTEHFAAALDVMLWGPIHATLAALPMLRQSEKPVIVNITSIGGKIPAPHLLPYTTAKFAAVGFSEGLRAELAKEGVSVTTAVPGLVRTGSPRNATFTGNRVAEHRWFTLADSIPVLSMDAERAAARIVTAALRGRPEVILTPVAKVAVRLHGLAPGLTTRAASLVDRLLPRGSTGSEPVPGHALRLPPAWFRGLTTLTRRAARRYHQYDDPTDAAQ